MNDSKCLGDGVCTNPTCPTHGIGWTFDGAPVSECCVWCGTQAVLGEDDEIMAWSTMDPDCEHELMPVGKGVEW